MGLIEILLATNLTLSATGFFEQYGYFDSATDTINPDGGITRTELSLFQQNLRNLIRNLKKDTLLVTTLQNEGLSGWVDDANHERIGTGAAFELLNILQSKFGFKYKIVPPAENVFGTSSGGILEMLQNSTVDLAAAFLPIMREYNNRTVYSPSLDTGHWHVLLKRPKESATGEGLLAPFTLVVWLYIIGSLILIAPTMYIVLYIYSIVFKTEDYKHYRLPGLCWFAYGAILKQGSTYNPITDTSRMLFATWWLFITIITAFYTANLTAFLTLSKFTLPINSGEEIGGKKLPWITTRGNALEDRKTYVNQSIGEPREYINGSDKYILNNYVLEKKLLFVRETPIVFNTLYDDYKLKAHSGVPESGRCTYVITEFDVMRVPRAFGYSKKFKYGTIFDRTLRNLVEGGVIKYQLNKDLPGVQVCPLDLGNLERRMGNSDLFLTYVITGSGLSMAFGLFIIELITWRVTKHLKKKKLADKNNNTNFNKLATKENGEYNTKFGFNNDNNGKLQQPPPQPPDYYTLFNPTAYNQNIRKKTINGRDYWIHENQDGNDRTMVPLRTPSALLFQFTN